MNISLTSGSISKNITLFSFPLVASGLLQVLFNMSDIAVVGHFAGSLALGCVGSVAQLIFFVTGLIIGVTSATNVLTAYWLGAKSRKDLTETLETSFTVALALGIAVAVLGILLGRPVLLLMGTKDELLSGSVLYFMIYMAGVPGLALYNFSSAVLSAAGDTKSPLIYLSIAGGVNIALNLFFVIVLKLSVLGVALASAISLCVSAVLSLAHLIRGRGAIRLRIRGLKINIHKARQILKLGIPTGLQNSIFAFANIFIQSAVNRFSSVMVAGVAVSSNADPLVYEAMGAVYTAAATFIAQNYGAGNRRRVRSSYLFSLFLSSFIGLLLGLSIYFFSDAFLFLFTSDPVVAAAAKKRIGIMAFSYFISAFMDCSIAASRGLGKTFTPAVFVILGSCVFRILWVKTVFSYFMTIESLFLLYPFSWGLTAVSQVIYFIHTYKKSFS